MNDNLTNLRRLVRESNKAADNRNRALRDKKGKQAQEMALRLIKKGYKPATVKAAIEGEGNKVRTRARSAPSARKPKWERDQDAAARRAGGRFRTRY